jgi:parallel beta-helix repeat protein
MEPGSNPMKILNKITLLSLVSLVACTTPNIVEQPPLQTERRILGLVNVDFALENNVVVAKAKFTPSPSMQVQAGPSAPPALNYNAVTLTRAFTGRTDYTPTRQRFIFSNFRLTNNTGSAFQNLTFYGVRLNANVGDTALFGLAREDGSAVPNIVNIARTMKPNHGMRINSTSLSLEVDPDKADFQAISTADAGAITSATNTADPNFFTNAGITDVLDYGFSARNFNTSGNRRVIPANGGQGQVTISLNYPLAPNTFDNPARWTWVFLVVDEPTTRVTRSLEETSSTGVAERARDTGATNPEIVLMGRTGNPSITVLKPSPLTGNYNGRQIAYNQIRIATFPTFISDVGALWVQANASPGGNGSPGLPFQTIQEAVNAAEPSGDVIRVRAGTYPEVGDLTINKSVQIYGPVSSTDGRDPSRCVTGTEPSCSSDARITGLTKITATGQVTMAGFRFFDTSADPVANPNARVVLDVQSLGNHILENNVFYRDGGNACVSNCSPLGVTSVFAPVKGVIALKTANLGGGGVTVRQNRVTGNPVSGAGLFANKSFGGTDGAAISIGGGLNTTVVRDNTMNFLRTAMFVNNPTASYLITGNTFTDNATAFGLQSVAIANMTISGNTFSTTDPIARANATYFNLQNTVPNTFTLTASNNTYDSKLPSAMSLSELFQLENQTRHRIDNDPFGLVRFVPNNLYFTPRSCPFEPTTGCTVGTADPQRAINIAAAGSTIHIDVGTYTNQLTITKDLTILGQGATTIIKAPAVLTGDPLSAGITSVVRISNNATVTMNMLKVSGPGPTGCGSLTYGIFAVEGSTLNISNSTLEDIRDNPISGCQNGIAIRAGSGPLFQSGTLNANTNIFTGFQKGAVIVDGTGSTGTITGNTITGVGPTGIAANGIQISRNATATVSGNTISNNQCNIASPTCGLSGAWSTGILLFEAGATTISGNTISDSDAGILISDGVTGTAVNGNTLTNNLYANISIYNGAGSMTMNGNILTGGTNSGLDLYHDSGATSSLTVTGMGNKISGALNGIEITDTAPADAYQINLNLSSGNITGTTYAVKNNTTVLAVLPNNWWGDPSGPNPPGTGSAILGPVNFTPPAGGPF